MMASTALDWSRIKSAIHSQFLPYIGEQYRFDSIESTNQFLIEQPPSPNKMDVCIAEHQTKGRGRRGKNWVTSANRNIILSAGWSFRRWHPHLPLLSLGVATALCKALDEFNIECQVKWPNDIYLQGKKLGGILIDTSGSVAGSCHAIIGCGINVDLSDGDTASIDQTYIDIKSSRVALPTTFNRNSLIAAMINYLCELLLEFTVNEASVCQSIIQQWQQRALFLNQAISVYKKDDATLMLQGKMLGVSDNGALIIQTSDCKRHFLMDSDVTIRQP